MADPGIDRNELAAWLRLDGTPGVGPVAARALLAAFGLPQLVLAQDAATLARHVPAAVAQALLRPDALLEERVERTWTWLSADGGEDRHVLTLADPRYPRRLLEIPDPPSLLYIQGRVEALACDAIAVVGSRNPTPQGERNACAFARDLAASGWVVVSGLALGIDAAAHRGALEGAPAGQMATVAVVGTGLDRVYPRQNHALAHDIAGRGALVSELALGTPPLAHNFPRRNRLIAGLTRGTLVVEAALRSGSLITARAAAEQGREVFAIPGSIHAPQSRGCHRLIRDGARLVESVQDIADELGPAGPRPAAVDGAAAAWRTGGPSEAPARVTTDAASVPVLQHAGPDPVLKALGHDPLHFDELLARTGLEAAALQVRLLDLELQGDVARLSGGLFQRLFRG